ncbi:MAG: protease [Moorea sp. SIO3I7]|uniref:M10 family metallopeptidase n=1 Tax=unclassified Moorena TaxID=2683338 RepID=UPI0013BEE1A0|nr:MULTISPECIES: M10 family metallopeptidase [unclassified Moorena]NEN94901.1 protease [Moorena sp. SIO3I7]NEO07413.1 protease [Moorena sp. SIO3I8]NEP23912.1 protease [Moorena sp. SIO3I6]
MTGLQSTTVTATGNNNIDGLLSGVKWSSTSLSFSFPNSINDYESNYPHRTYHGASFQTLNATQRAVAGAWIGPGGEFYNVSLLNPSELTGANDRNATIRMAESNIPPELGSNTAWAYYPANTVQGGDIWFNPNDYNNPVIGNFAYHTFGHELGHALGLKHGHQIGGVSNVAMNSDRDSMEFSIMTYRSYVGHSADHYTNEEFGYAQSLMMYDIAAIQHMYGAWFGYNATNTTYKFSTTTGEMFVNGVGQGTPGANRIFRTIWDGNGIDTYDFSNYTTNLSIDLSPGGWSNLDTSGGHFQQAYLGNGHYARGHVFNALQYNGDSRSLIENAYGGSGNDRISGNSANNKLLGNSGNDTLYGYGGNDTLDGGTGNDTLDGGNGDDLLYLGDGNDYVNITSLGDDTFHGGNGNDYIYGYTGNERYYGDAGNDTLKGFSGDDTMIGGANSDTLFGGSGDDVLTGSNPNVFNSGTGEYDNLTGNAGADIFVLGDSYEAYYRGVGYANILDFNSNEGDRIRVFGSASSYSLYYSVTDPSDITIFYQGDLIGILDETTNVSISRDFIFV